MENRSRSGLHSEAAFFNRLDLMLGRNRSMPLDPQAQDFLSRLAAAGLPSIQDQTVDQARAQVNLSTRFLGKPPRVQRVEDRKIAGPGGDLAIRVITPEGAGPGPLPVVVFFHGGGWVLGNLSSHEGVCRAIANASKSIVMAVDYRLAPEHPFPAAAEDAHAALAWLATHASEIGGDPSRIAVCGDSAGGNLATVATLMARDRGGPHVVFQALAYPITDCYPDTDSYREFAEGCFLSRSEMLWYWDQYVPNIEDRLRPYASPNRADDLSKLPPALVLTAGYDVLRDEGEAYARRLAEAGVPVKLSRYDGMIHGFLRRYPFFDQGRAAIEEIGAALREAFGVTATCSDADGGG
jgi:acetyl esterase